MIHKKSTEEELAYQGTLHYLYNNLAAYQQQGNKAIKKMGLEKITKLCKALGHPEKKFKSIHIAGTNGKGSTSHALAAVLQSAGYKTGLYTSPHIKDFRERIQINGKLITKGEVIAFVQKHKNLFENTQASFFEMSVALVFYFFAKQQVDIAVIEVGLGGRLDATNVILPEVALITNISLDHTSILGGTLSAIAYEKAGVVKLQIPLIVGEYDAATAEVFQQVAKAKKAKLVYASDSYQVNLVTQKHDQLVVNVAKGGEIAFENLVFDSGGLYQMKNIPGILSLIDMLNQKGWNIDGQSIRQGLGAIKLLTRLLGRWKILATKPMIICDTAHNEAGIKQVIQQLKKLNYSQLHIVLGLSKKPIQEILAILGVLPREATYYFVQSQLPRSMQSAELAHLADTLGLQGTSYLNAYEGFSNAKKNTSYDEHAIMLAIGSIYMIAEMI